MGEVRQKRDEALLRHWMRKQEALADIATHLGERPQIGAPLDALADRGGAELVREIDGGLAQRGIARVIAAVRHQVAVELELGEGKLLEPRQMRVARAEIVERERYVVDLELRRDLLGQRDVAHRLVLGNLEDEARPAVIAGMMLAYDRRNRQLDQIAHRDVDRELQREAVGIEPVPAPERGRDRARAQFERAGLVGLRNERSRREHAMLRVSASRQELGGDDVLFTQ